MQNNLTKRKLRSIESRKRILKTAETMIKKKGFDNVTIDEICAELKISKGGFYHFFRSKDEIVLEQVLEIDAYYKKIFEKELRDYSGTEKLLKFIELICKHIKYRAGKDLFRNLYRSLMMTNKTRQTLINKDRFFFTLLTEIIKEAQEKRELPRDLNTQNIVAYVAILMRGMLFNWCLYERDFDVEKLAIKIISTFLKGLNTEAVSHSSTG